MEGVRSGKGAEVFTVEPLIIRQLRETSKTFSLSYRKQHRIFNMRVGEAKLILF